MANRLNNIVGHVFGSLTVLARVEGRHEARWLCRCQCGIERIFPGSKIRRGDARCYCRGGRAKHGRSDTHLYTVWARMKSRCADISMNRYGGRGISVCSEWVHDFRAFESWAVQNGWQNGLELDRVDNDGNYEPKNCRFVTTSENCRNRSTNRTICFDGKSMLLVEWAEHTGIPMKVLHNRINRYGWTEARALSTPHMSVLMAARHRSERKSQGVKS